MDPTVRDILVNAAGNLVASATTVGGAALIKYRRTLRAWADAGLSEVLQWTLPQSRERMRANAEGYLDHVAGELAQHKPEGAALQDGAATWLGERLTDPATAVSFQTALFAASQTSSEQRHAMLAKLVVEHMGAEADSARAAESAFAVEASTRLGREHFYVLGVLVLVRHVGRLPVIALPPDVAYTGYTEAGYAAALDTLRPRAPEAARPFVAAFVRWVEQHGIEQLASQTVALHLASAGCLTTSSTGLRFRDAIAPAEQGLENAHPQALYTAWVLDQIEAQLRADPVGTRLINVWERSLSYLTPTPAGILIGLAVHDAKTGDREVRRGEWGPNDDRPWHPGVRPWGR